MRKLRGMVASLSLRPSLQRTPPGVRRGEEPDCTARFIALLTALVITWLLVALGCASSEPAAVFVDDYDAATLTVLVDDAGVEKYEILHLTDPQAVDILRGYFRRVGEMPVDVGGGRVEPLLVVNFEHGVAGTFRVESDYQVWTWDKGRGRFPVAGDLAAFVQTLRQPPPVTQRD